jgi:hypothetical protein
VNDHSKLSNPVTLGLALAAGGGLILMITALAIGVSQADNANGTSISTMLILGLALFIFGLVGWVAVVRPYEHFDDINVPKYTGHHDHDEHAIVVAEPHDVIIIKSHDTPPHAESHS